jgi:type IV pilus assembly protein PilQ
MYSLIRFSLLIVCGAAGVGLAISLALTIAPGDEPSPADQAAKLFQVAKDEVPPSAPAVTIAQQLPSVPPAVVVPHQPAVAQNAELTEAIEKLQQATERNGDTFTNILDNLQQRNAPPTAAAAPAPAIDQPLPPPAIDRAPEDAPPPEVVERGIAQVARGEGDDQLQINVQNSDIRKVLGLISSETGLNVLVSKSVTGNVSASLTNVGINDALEAILKSTGYVARREGKFVFIGTPADLDDMDRAQDVLGSRVYRPNYVRSADLQQLITPMLSQGVGKVSVSMASEVDIQADTVKTGGNSFAGSDVIIVRDYEQILRQVDQLIAEIDVQPRQVAIEAMILSVKLDDEYSFGVDFQLLRDKHNVRLVSGSSMSNLAQVNLTGDGLRFGFLDASTGAFINALETIGETNVVAAPRVLCLNKQRAEILIGSQLGYVSTTVTENASTQSIEFLEVGTQLRIRPFIFTDGSIRLEVHPELSTGNVRVESGFTLPDKEVTQVTTNVMCRDGSTVIIGGLIREDLSNNTNQLPFFGSMPYVGWLFRNKTENTTRHEIIVLITPRLVCEPGLSGEGRQAQQEFAARQANYADKMSPIAARHYSRHFLRRANAAWNAGDNLAALRYSNLAVHFDPQNLEANNMRTQAASTMPEHDQRLDNYLKDGLPLWQRPHKDYTKQGYPWTVANPAADEPIFTEYDPGVPGHSFDLHKGPPPQRKLAP